MRPVSSVSRSVSVLIHAIMSTRPSVSWAMAAIKPWSLNVSSGSSIAITGPPSRQARWSSSSISWFAPQARSQIQPRAVLDPVRRGGVDVTLAHQQVLLARHLAPVAVLGAEQHLVGRLDRAHMGTDGDALGPHEALGHRGRGRDQDARARPALLTLGDL